MAVIGKHDTNKEDIIKNSTRKLNNLFNVKTRMSQSYGPSENVMPNVIKLSGKTDNNELRYQEYVIGLYYLRGTRNGAPSYSRFKSQTATYIIG